MGNGTDLADPFQEQTLRHFVLQHTRPTHLGDVELVDMDPLLRGLLFTDGTVTRTLEVQLLSPTSVAVIAQTPVAAGEQLAEYLNAEGGTEAVRRRVEIRTGPHAAPAIWAESHILPIRLPEEFLGVLDTAPDGIGESLQRVELESWRELLWFGLEAPPRWSDPDSRGTTTVITRLYRVITSGSPALLISESFAVVRRNGVYCLDCAS